MDKIKLIKKTWGKTSILTPKWKKAIKKNFGKGKIKPNPHKI